MNARAVTVVVSVVVHGALAIAALTASDAKKKHEATTVSVLDEKKKVEPPKPPPPPPPPPPPKAAPPPPAHVAKVAPVAPQPEIAPPPEAPSEPQHVESNYGNGDGTGPSVGKTPEKVVPTAPPKVVKPSPKAAKVDKPPVAPPPVSSNGVCTEPPGKPEPTRKSEIEYTDEARAAGVEGRLVLKITVDADGNVTKVEVVSSVDAQLDAAAIATVKTWHFKPALACGKPVAGGTYTLARKFELSD